MHTPIGGGGASTQISMACRWLLVVALCFAAAAACPAGYFEDSGACYACEAGKFSAAAGATVCTVCPDGTYQPSRGSTACRPVTACGVGMMVTRVATTTSDFFCEMCPAGFFGNVTGAQFCHECSPGYYQDTPGKMVCKAAAVCPPGKHIYLPATPQTDVVCSACLAGTFSANAEAAGCTSCPIDRYQPEPGATACIPKSTCAPGTYVFSDGSHLTDRVCRACPAGTFSATENHRECTACSPGTFSAEAGATACVTARRCGDREERAPPTTSTDRLCESDSDATASTVQAVFIALGMLVFIVLGGVVGSRAHIWRRHGPKHTRLINPEEQ